MGRGRGVGRKILRNNQFLVLDYTAQVVLRLSNRDVEL